MNLKSLKSENSKLTTVIEREISNEFDMKIEALENRMNEKNRALHVSIVQSVNIALQQKPSYAGVIGQGGARPKEPVQHAGVGLHAAAFGQRVFNPEQGLMGPPLPPAARLIGGAQQGAVGGQL